MKTTEMKFLQKRIMDQTINDKITKLVYKITPKACEATNKERAKE